MRPFAPLSASTLSSPNLHPAETIDHRQKPHKGRTGLVCLHRFRGPLGGRLLQRRGSLILRKLSLLLGPQKVFCALADMLNQERDLRFASAMVQALNVILLTAPEVTAATQHCSVLIMCFPSAVAAPLVMWKWSYIVSARNNA